MPISKISCCSLMLHARILLGLPSSPVTVWHVDFLVSLFALGLSRCHPCVMQRALPVLPESRDGHRDNAQSSPKGKLVPPFLQGSCTRDVAVLIVVPSIHPQWLCWSGWSSSLASSLALLFPIFLQQLVSEKIPPFLQVVPTRSWHCAG